MTGLETDIVEVKRETEKRLRQSLIAAYFGMPILLLFFYTVIFFAFSSIVVIFVPQSGDQQVEKILFVWNSLREIPEGHYEFGIVALAALQATIFIGSQNRVLGKEESVRASEANYLFNKFSFFISILISSILFVILVASIGNFSFWITLVIFWISTGLISLFAKSATEAEQSLQGTEASLEKLKNNLDRVSNVESGSVSDGNHPFRSVLSRCFTLFPSRWAKFSQYLKLLVANKLIWLQFIIFGLFIYFTITQLEKEQINSKTSNLPLILEASISVVLYYVLEFLVLYLLLGLESSSNSTVLEKRFFKFIFIIIPLLVIVRIEVYGLISILFMLLAIISTPIINYYRLKTISSSNGYKEILKRLIKENISKLGNQISLEKARQDKGSSPHPVDSSESG